MARTSRQHSQYRYRTNTQDLDWTEERADATSQNIGEGQRLISAVAGTGCWQRRYPSGHGWVPCWLR
jgi:hypothetical protein